MNISFSDLDELKNLVSELLEQGLQKQIDPLVRRVEGVEGLSKQVQAQAVEIGNLKANQAKALVGWTLLTTGFGLIASHTWAYIASHFHS